MSWRPWTAAAKRVARMRGHKRKPVEPIKDWKIVRGDLVSNRRSLNYWLAHCTESVFLGGGVVRNRQREARCGVGGGKEEKLSHGPRSQRCTKYALMCSYDGAFSNGSSNSNVVVFGFLCSICDGFPRGKSFQEVTSWQSLSSTSLMCHWWTQRTSKCDWLASNQPSGWLKHIYRLIGLK